MRGLRARVSIRVDQVLRHYISGDEFGIRKEWQYVKSVGKIDEYDVSKEEWPQYVERVSHFFTTNGIDDANRKQ